MINQSASKTESKDCHWSIWRSVMLENIFFITAPFTGFFFVLLLKITWRNLITKQSNWIRIFLDFCQSSEIVSYKTFYKIKLLNLKPQAYFERSKLFCSINLAFLFQSSQTSMLYWPKAKTISGCTTKTLPKKVPLPDPASLAIFLVTLPFFSPQKYEIENLFWAKFRLFENGLMKRHTKKARNCRRIAQPTQKHEREVERGNTELWISNMHSSCNRLIERAQNTTFFTPTQF